MLELLRNSPLRLGHAHLFNLTVSGSTVRANHHSDSDNNEFDLVIVLDPVRDTFDSDKNGVDLAIGLELARTNGSRR